MVTPRPLLVLLCTIATLAAACASSQPPPASPPSVAATVPSVGVPAAPVGTDPQISLPGGASGWLQLPPTDGGKHPAILLIHEWWGVDDWMKQDAARFAAKGYVSLAVDLYRGKVAHDPSEAHELSRGLSEDRALADMKAGVDWLAARPDVDPQRIGVIGWCLGGGYALALTVAEPRLRAAVVNYGKLVSAPEKIAAIHASLLGDFAGQDRGISPDDVRAFAEKLKADHKDADIKIYEGAKHAFMNPNDKDGYDDAAARDAWVRIDAFLARTLGR